MTNSNSKHRKKKRKGISKGPPLFSEVGAEARGLFEKGYVKDHKFSISAQRSTGMALTSASVKLGKYYDAYLAAKYNCQNATFDVKFDSKLQILTSAVASVKLGKYSSAYLAAKYNCKTATIDVNIDSKSQLSGSLSFSGKFSPSTKTIAYLKLPNCSSSEVQTINHLVASCDYDCRYEVYWWFILSLIGLYNIRLRNKSRFSHLEHPKKIEKLINYAIIKRNRIQLMEIL